MYVRRPNTYRYIISFNNTVTKVLLEYCIAHRMYVFVYIPVSYCASVLWWRWRRQRQHCQTDTGRMPTPGVFSQFLFLLVSTFNFDSVCLCVYFFVGAKTGLCDSSLFVLFLICLFPFFHE